MTEHVAWPKTTRGYSKVTATEKINGANVAIHIEKFPFYVGNRGLHKTESIEQRYCWNLSAQSRNRMAYIGEDTVGIANWVDQRIETLVDDLGEGIHYGEFVKKQDKVYLFNTGRWSDVEFTTAGLDIVPVLFEGEMYPGMVEELLDDLRNNGSRVMDSPPEGICVFWHGDRTVKKYYTGLVKQ